MRHRTSNLRALLTAAVLALALGAPQAAMLPQSQEGAQGWLTTRDKRTANRYDGWLMGTVYFYRVTSVLTPTRPPLVLPRTSKGNPPFLFGGSQQPVVENAGRKMVDDNSPI